MLYLRFFIIVVTVVGICTGTGHAQSRRDVQSSQPIPSNQMQSLLIKNTLVALNHANVTGNYSVLRDVLSPEARQEQTASDLAVAFRPLRDRAYDLSFVFSKSPILSSPPSMSADGLLTLVGWFDTHPDAFHFRLEYRRTQTGDWWIHRIGVARAQPVHQPAAAVRQVGYERPVLLPSIHQSQR